jgi:hypothetical protein
VSVRDANDAQKRRYRKVNMAKKMKEIKSWKDIPAFETEKEEQEFWSTHEPSQEMLDQMSPAGVGPLPPPRPRKQLLSIRMEGELLNRLKALAAVKDTSYQTLLRQFVADRVYEEEKREGILKQ